MSNMMAPRPRFCTALIAGMLLSLFLTGCEDESFPANTAPPPSVLDSLPPAPAAPSPQGTAPRLVRSQTLHVPAYSHIYVRDAQRTVNLATTLSIRNASPDRPITLTAIDYYDSNGALVRSYTDTARQLAPLASTSVVVEQDDIRGGVGANFLVRWQADTPVPPPVVEAVMITSESTLGISFRSTAQVLYEDVPAE